MKLSQHLFLCIGLFRFFLQRNTVLNTKETLKVLPLSDRLAAENSQFSWCDECDIKIAPVIALVLLFDSRSKTALSAYVVCQSYFTWTSRAWSLMIKNQWWGTGVRRWWCSRAYQGEPLLSTFPFGCNPFPSRFIHTPPGSGGL